MSSCVFFDDRAHDDGNYASCFTDLQLIAAQDLSWTISSQTFELSDRWNLPVPDNKFNFFAPRQDTQASTQLDFSRIL